MSDTLKFPTGQFTHSELASHNGKTNQQVWTAYQKAIKDGTIVFVGLRTGKGKPSKLYQVAGPGVTAVTDTTKAAPVVQILSIPPTVEETVVEHIKKLSATATDALVVEAATSEPDVELEEEEVRPKRVVDPSYRTLAETCPICHQPVIAWDDETGVMVQCNQPISVCPCHENPYGHGRTEKAAYEILCQKYNPSR